MPIYLDYAASTPLDPNVLKKMQEVMSEVYGNPSSAHEFGQKAKDLIVIARAQVSDLIHAEPEEIVFTSGATEANNLALKGASQLYKAKGKHIITLKTEHPAVLDCCQQLEKDGFSVTYLPVETNGLLSLEKFQQAIRPETILVSVMHVNNEIGVIQDIEAIAQMTSQRNILFHVDAAQSAGKIKINLKDTPIDLMSFSAHKIYGPKGIGALYVRRKPRIKVAAQIHGGGHEQGMRSGTLATHQIVGMGEAFAVAKNVLTEDHKRIAKLKESFWNGIKNLKSVALNGDFENTLPNIINIRFNGVSAKELMQSLPNFAISAGSACHAKGDEPSYVLRALGLSAEEAKCGVRFSFGRFTTQDEVDAVVRELLFDQAPKKPLAFQQVS